MKTVTTLIFTILFAALGIAQNGINYKAIIKDSNGNVIANDLISVQFTVLQGVAQTTVYKENHTPTTDANGLIIVNIGEGTPATGTFATIDWASDTTFLNTRINTGAGLIDLGTTEFKTVPYALNTKTASVAANVTGLEAIDEGNGIGWRLKGRDPNNYGNLGLNAIDLSFGTAISTAGAIGAYSTAMGAESTASGLVSTAMGHSTSALGERSTAMGANTISSNVYDTAMGYLSEANGGASTAMGFGSNASGEGSTAMRHFTSALGEHSTAMGSNSTASGLISTAMGFNTTASGKMSSTMGSNTTASSSHSFAIGRYNIGGGNPSTWVATDPLFEVGFGTEATNKLNAFTITKNGKVGIGTHIPTTFLQITNGYDASLVNGTGYFVIGRESGTNMVFDNNEILVRNNGANSNLYLQQEGGNVYVGGTLAHSSDSRLKKDISPLSYGLETILELNPVEYNWINREQEFKSLGLIAQEVQPIIKNIVHVKDDEDKTLSLSYTELIPVLIKAIQEQQEIIESMKLDIGNQQSIIKGLTAELEQKEKISIDFDQRLKQIESLMRQNDQ